MAKARDILDATKWTEIRDFRRYSINRDGEVANNITGHLLKVSFAPRLGYTVKLVDDVANLQRVVKLADLLARTFVPSVLDATQVVFIDGDKKNLDLNNLEYRL
ncbi:His-Me finger endonuclease [Listeria phage LP-KV022]|uniref:His-Me finger endonuclease n=3 Tax=Homburgvirus TaxID=1921125 RepID=A0A5A4K5V6_9CAUD|nr:His-Me finger endonuclease [Listeria phage LP-110]YP_008240543.1 His-Me finger endonuclease [Listeria phage LP-037]AGI11541.1 His-Me finger endonuclease [Listeria phage LP-110]AGI11680.1 His-Me finger endonuclease [Listeria phage LP-037]AWY07732.1 His-Me finger endonuclease [Listeria phage LP-KV022]